MLGTANAMPQPVVQYAWLSNSCLPAVANVAGPDIIIVLGVPVSHAA